MKIIQEACGKKLVQKTSLAITEGGSSSELSYVQGVNMRTAQTTLSALVRDAQTGPVCLTRYGRPLAIVVGVEGRDLAEVFREWDPAAQPASGRRAKKKR